jgi:hypothetical protein
MLEGKIMSGELHNARHIPLTESEIELLKLLLSPPVPGLDREQQATARTIIKKLQYVKWAEWAETS